MHHARFSLGINVFIANLAVAGSPIVIEQGLVGRIGLIAEDPDFDGRVEVGDDRDRLGREGELLRFGEVETLAVACAKDVYGGEDANHSEGRDDRVSANFSRSA